MYLHSLPQHIAEESFDSTNRFLESAYYRYPHDTQYTLHLTWKFCDTYLKSFLEFWGIRPNFLTEGGPNSKPNDNDHHHHKLVILRQDNGPVY